MSPAYHIGQAGKPEPLAALCHWLHITNTWSPGYWLHWLHWLHWLRVVLGCRALAVPLAAVRLRIEAPGRADGDRATLTVTPQTIYFFF